MIMLDRIKSILQSKGFDTSSITEETQLIADLKLKSLNIIELVNDLENEFDIEIPDRSIRDLKTIGNVISLVESLQDK